MMLLLLSLELLATDGPLVDNEGAVRNIGEAVGTKNASCSELADHSVKCSELRGC